MAALRRLVDAALEAGGTAWNFVRDRRNLHLTAPMLSLPVVALLILRSRRPVVVRALSMAALLTLLEADRVAEVHTSPGTWDVVVSEAAASSSAAAAAAGAGTGPAASAASSGSGARLIHRVAVTPLLFQLYKGRLRKAMQRGSVAVVPRKAGVVSSLGSVLLVLLPAIYLFVLYKVMQRLQNPTDEVGRRVRRSRRSTTFKDVAGIDHVVQEVNELVTFMRDPAAYTRMGARFPRGVLLHGPSGTGKTLVARAVAGEAGVPFISCSASDFVEMLVGRGASRIRNLFQRARKMAPCIVFIDELDALGKSRGGVNSHDEREQTLNQLLTCMDGFEAELMARKPVLVIAATNRAEVLDSALCRPGRFDRLVQVGLPDETARLAILKVHAAKVCMATDAHLESIAASSDGLSGADLANVVNEAALLAVRARSDVVTQQSLEAALTKVVVAKARVL